MTEVIKGLYVGGDLDVATARERGYAICTCAKEGPNGHRAILKYHTLGAPKGKDYYFVERDKHLALNLVDSDDPNFIPKAVIDAAIQFIAEHHGAGKPVLVHCNMGHSRGPSTALLYLRAIGEMPYSFVQSEKVYHTLYPDYEPGQGMRQYARSHWSELEPKEK